MQIKHTLPASESTASCLLCHYFFCHIIVSKKNPPVVLLRFNFFNFYYCILLNVCCVLCVFAACLLFGASLALSWIGCLLQRLPHLPPSHPVTSILLCHTKLCISSFIESTNDFCCLPLFLLSDSSILKTLSRYIHYCSAHIQTISALPF